MTKLAPTLGAQVTELPRSKEIPQGLLHQSTVSHGGEIVRWAGNDNEVAEGGSYAFRIGEVIAELLGADELQSIDVHYSNAERLVVKRLDEGLSIVHALTEERLRDVFSLP